jgi:hypothetical protein
MKVITSALTKAGIMRKRRKSMVLISKSGWGITAENSSTWTLDKKIPEQTEKKKNYLCGVFVGKFPGKATLDGTYDGRGFYHSDQTAMALRWDRKSLAEAHKICFDYLLGGRVKLSVCYMRSKRYKV